MSKIVKGTMNVGNELTQGGEHVLSSINGTDLADSAGNIVTDAGAYLTGNYGETLIFDDPQYNTSSLVLYERMVNTADELADEKAYSTATPIIDVLNSTTLTYTGGTWVSSPIMLNWGRLYSNTRTKKMFYVNGAEDIRLVAGQTVGNRTGEIADMSYYPFLKNAASGYQQLPNGLILQWAYATTVAGTVTITLPVPFKSVMIGGLAGDFTSNSWTTNAIQGNIDYAGSTLSTVKVNYHNFYGTTTLSLDSGSTPTLRILVWGF